LTGHRVRKPRSLPATSRSARSRAHLACTTASRRTRLARQATLQRRDPVSSCHSGCRNWACATPGQISELRVDALAEPGVDKKVDPRAACARWKVYSRPQVRCAPAARSFVISGATGGVAIATEGVGSLPQDAPRISVGRGAPNDWHYGPFLLSLRRRRSHVRIVSGPPTFSII